MKRTIAALCALAMVMAGAVPIRAAEAQTGRCYPVEVKEYLEGGSCRISKVYQLSLSDDPSAIPTDDFEWDGRLYRLLDMTRRDETSVDAKPYTQTVTVPSNTSNLEKILQTLSATLEAVTEDGYTGVLRLDHTTVKVAADGYATRSQTLSATRTYPNLSDADASLIPKTIQENGRTLELSNVSWRTVPGGNDALNPTYTATVTYTGTASSRYAIGYTVTADYTGEVVKTVNGMVTYTAIFGGVEEPEESETPDSGGCEDQESRTAAQLDTWIWIAGCVILVLVVVAAFAGKKRKERK